MSFDDMWVRPTQDVLLLDVIDHGQQLGGRDPRLRRQQRLGQQLDRVRRQFQAALDLRRRAAEDDPVDLTPRVRFEEELKVASVNGDGSRTLH
jgi:hypothetical protein